MQEDRSKLDERMMRSVGQASRDADAMLIVVDASDPPEKTLSFLEPTFKSLSVPTAVVLNKAGSSEWAHLSVSPFFTAHDCFCRCSKLQSDGSFRNRLHLASGRLGSHAHMVQVQCLHRWHDAVEPVHSNHQHTLDAATVPRRLTCCLTMRWRRQHRRSRKCPASRLSFLWLLPEGAT